MGLLWKLRRYPQWVSPLIFYITQAAKAVSVFFRILAAQRK